MRLHRLGTNHGVVSVQGDIPRGGSGADLQTRARHLVQRCVVFFPAENLSNFPAGFEAPWTFVSRPSQCPVQHLQQDDLHDAVDSKPGDVLRESQSEIELGSASGLFHT